MILFKRKKDIENKLQLFRNNGKTIGFVPTMGALHEGHISLIKASKKQNDVTVCSIFVNPVQFNDPSDYEKYPVTIESDIYKLEKCGVDILFLPSVNEIYPQGTNDLKHYNLGYLETVLEGKYRPGHFQGVCAVVHRLLNIIQPNQIYLGQKDFQQCMVIKRLTETEGLDVEEVIAPTIREKSGLAMSSRNMRLSEQAKGNAVAIFQALQFIQKNIASEKIPTLKTEASKIIMNAGFDKIDYIEIANATDLNPLTEFDPSVKSVVLIAAFIDGIRLIDNALL